MKYVYQFLLLTVFTVIFVGCTEDKTTEPTATPYDAAVASKGGIMYDKFWATEASYQGSSTNIAKFDAAADFFRCKQCHGWDLLGTSGSYISRGAKSNRPNVSSINLYQIAKTKTAQELFDAMKRTTGRRDISYDLTQYNPSTNATDGDQMPNLAQLLTDTEIWNIVKFMKEGAVDVSLLYDGTYTGTYPTGSAKFTNVGKDGNATTGSAFYVQNCQSCHGSDGKTIALEGLTAGKFVRSKPNEVQHKVKYGQLGSTMTGHFNITISQTKDLYKAFADTLAFPN